MFIHFYLIRFPSLWWWFVPGDSAFSLWTVYKSGYPVCFWENTLLASWCQWGAWEGRLFPTTFLTGVPRECCSAIFMIHFFGNGWTSCQIPVNRGENWGGVPKAWRGGWAEPQGFPESQKRKGLKWVGWPASCRCWCWDLCGKFQWAAHLPQRGSRACGGTWP